MARFTDQERKEWALEAIKQGADRADRIQSLANQIGIKPRTLKDWITKHSLASLAAQRQSGEDSLINTLDRASHQEIAMSNPFSGRVPDHVWHSDSTETQTEWLQSLDSDQLWVLLHDLAPAFHGLRAAAWHPDRVPDAQETFTAANTFYARAAACFSIKSDTLDEDHSYIHDYSGLPVDQAMKTMDRIRRLSELGWSEQNDDSDFEYVVEDLEYEIMGLHNCAFTLSESVTSAEQLHTIFNTKVYQPLERLLAEKLSYLRALIHEDHLTEYDTSIKMLNGYLQEITESAKAFGGSSVELRASRQERIVN